MIETPLFLVREGRIAEVVGPRQWRATTKDLPESIKRIKAALPEGRRVYVYDVDGVEANAPNHEFHQKLERAHVPFWLHAGCRSPEDAMDAFFAGAEAITVEARHMRADGLTELAGLADGEIHLGYRFSGSRPQPDMRAFEIERLAKDAGASGLVLEATPPVDARAMNGLGVDLRSRGLEVRRIDIVPGLAPPTPEGFDEYLHPMGSGA